MAEMEKPTSGNAERPTGMQVFRNLLDQPGIHVLKTYATEVETPKEENRTRILYGARIDNGPIHLNLHAITPALEIAFWKAGLVNPDTRIKYDEDFLEITKEMVQPGSFVVIATMPGLGIIYIALNGRTRLYSGSNFDEAYSDYMINRPSIDTTNGAPLSDHLAQTL